MNGRALLWGAMLAIASEPVSAAQSDLERALLKLDPNTRAEQACGIRGIDQIRRDKKLAKPDRILSSILSPATFNGTSVQAKGGAVRANKRWFAMEYSCVVSDNHLKATSFDYKIGSEIPKAQWADLGLWE